MIRKTMMTMGRVLACGLMTIPAAICIVANVTGGANVSQVNGVCGCLCVLAFVFDKQLVRWRKQQEKNAIEAGA
jgi:hypothetical protein